MIRLNHIVGEGMATESYNPNFTNIEQLTVKDFSSADVNRWLQEDLGLNFNPFEYLESSKDPKLAYYLADHGVFNELLAPTNIVLVAPRGGGKTAFRVRLAYECRTRYGGKNILPLVLRSPGPAWSIQPDSLYRWLNWTLALEILFQFAYRPYEYSVIDSMVKAKLSNFVHKYFPSVDTMVEMMTEQQSLDPLIDYLDPAMRELPGQPLPGSIADFLSEWRAFEPALDDNSPEVDWNTITDFLLNDLNYDYVYILVDGVDDWPVGDKQRFELLQWVDLQNAAKIYAKYFIPREIDLGSLEKYKNILTNVTAYHIIKWDLESLQQVVRQRISAASSGTFDAFSALGDDDFPKGIEQQLAKVIKPSIPREILLLSQSIFTQHLQRSGPNGLLSRADVDNAIKLYSEHYSVL